MMNSLPPSIIPSTDDLFASIDMGTNSFKLIIVQAHPSGNGKFLPLHSFKDPVCLGRHSSPSISPHAHLRALHCLHSFNQILNSHHISPLHIRCVATAALRDADNANGFREAVRQQTGLDVSVLSGEEEARYVYLGVLQFLPLFHKRVLVVDIGGGSTEIVIGERGNIVLGVSLKLGHVGLTQRFGENIPEMMEFIRLVIKDSGMIEKVLDSGFEVVFGTSGTIRAIEKAVFHGYGHDLTDYNELIFRNCGRDWKFNKGELGSVVERLCNEGAGERARREEFFKRRSEFIVAGAVLLDEIFEVLGIEEMGVSKYALREGVIAETLSKTFEGYDLNANARWHSVVRLAKRFNDKKKIKFAAQCSRIAKEIFNCLRNWSVVSDNEVKLGPFLDEKGLECLEAACLLHNIGLFAGKKGYHKQSYDIIVNGDHLHGYSPGEVKLIALLARHHRKKFPKSDCSSLKEISGELKQKFTVLCTIIRVAFILQQNDFLSFHDMEFVHLDEGFQVVFKEAKDQHILHVAEDIGEEISKELKHLKRVIQH